MAYERIVGWRWVWGAVASAASGATVDIQRHRPSNVYAVGTPVVIEASVMSGRAEEAGVLFSAVRDDGVTVYSNRFSCALQAKRPKALAVDLGELEPGHYALSAEPEGGRPKRAEFCVVPLVPRTAGQAREQGRRFGIKVWQSGDIWWDRTLTWDAGEAMQACGLMGLQWTRAALADTSMGTQELATRFPFNVVSKVEGFPESCFDVKRFGPLEAYKKTEQGKSWAKSTLPLEVPYKVWLGERVAAAPADQKVFEIWNEPWQWCKTMSAEEFAALCTWAVSVIKERRPDAVVGPNIYGDVNAYDQAVLAAGGLDRMDFVAIHPYTVGTPEEKGFRQRLRNYRDMLRLKLGRDLDLYSTEYGWSTAPLGERVVGETEQARLTVRESLMLYAEDVKTLIPHTLGQRQQNTKEREDYFGFFRLGNEPKPVVAAFATCARMIDGSRFAGDLWLGPGIGAMLFERQGVFTLALWTEREAREIVLDAGAESVTAVGLMGRSTALRSAPDGLHVKIGPDVTYLTGVGAALEKGAAAPDAPLNPDLWAVRAGSHTMPRMAAAPAIDGKLDEWRGVVANTLHNPKLDDLKADWRLAWDDKALYVAVEVADRAVVNTNAPGHVAMGDAVVLQLGTRPERQVGKPDLYDFEITIAPASASGAPVLLMKNAAEKTLVNPSDGVRWSAVRAAKGWTAEAAVPFEALRADAPQAGQKMAFALFVFDRDRTDRDEWSQWWKRVETYDKKGRACQMPYLVLGK